VDTIRCVGCGKVIEDGPKTARVSIGKLVEGAFEEAKEWGVMHEGCFEQSVESPASALAKIRKLAKATTVTSPKKAAKSA
jgi:hypothetical protein